MMNISNIMGVMFIEWETEYMGPLYTSVPILFFLYLIIPLYLTNLIKIFQPFATHFRNWWLRFHNCEKQFIICVTDNKISKHSINLNWLVLIKSKDVNIYFVGYMLIFKPSSHNIYHKYAKIYWRRICFQSNKPKNLHWTYFK